MAFDFVSDIPEIHNSVVVQIEKFNIKNIQDDEIFTIHQTLSIGSAEC